MNRQFFAGVVAIIVATVCISVPDCSGWTDPLYIDSDWELYTPVGTTVEVHAWVVEGGPVYSWNWSWGSGQMEGASYGEYSSTSTGHFSSPGRYSVWVSAYGEGGSDDARTYVWNVDVVIDTPSSFPAYVALGQSLALGCTPLGATGGSFGWSKASGPGNVTFTPSIGAEDPSFSADQAGDYTVQVLYSKGATVSDTSGTIKVVAVTQVISSADYACVGQNVTFGAITNPPNCAPYVTITWSGGQNPATGSGSQFTTNWSTPGPKTVIATCGSSSAQKQVTVVAVDKVVKDVEGPPDEGPLYVLPGSSVALRALPDPIYSSFPSGKPIWVIQSYPDGANPSLSQNSGPTTTLSNLTVPGIYNVSAYCGNSDAISVVVVKVELQYCFPDILMYTGSHAQNTPTQNCVAIGKPSGGTFSWQCSTKAGGSGLLGIVNTVNSDPISTVTVKGAAPSSISNDAKITVSYTFDAKTIATADGYVTVHRPAVAASYSGYFDWQNRTTRRYFHPIGDQFGGLLYITGIPCDEVVTCIYGLDENVTSPGATAMHPAEKAPTYPWGNWNGGIAVKDTLGAPTAKMPNSAYRQELYAGGWHVATYTIYMQPLEDNPWPCIWKE